MSYELLYLNKLEISLYQKIKSDCQLMTIVYEHKINTSGIIYDSKSLEKYIKKYNTDPVKIEQIEIESLHDFFERNLNKIFVFEINNDTNSNEIIKNNYRKFEIYYQNK